MKKLFCLLLTIMMVLTISSIVFAASDDTSTDAAVQRNVDTATYKPYTTEIENSDPEVSPGLVDIEDVEIPLAPALPETGGIPAEAFYVAGASFVAAALILAFKKDKAGQKG